MEKNLQHKLKRTHFNNNIPFVLSSVPASEEDGSVGDRVSAGSISGGADCGSGLCHSHRQRACFWILPRHHREWQLPPIIDSSNTMIVTWCVLYFFICSFSEVSSNLIFCTSSSVLELFWVLLASTWWKTADPWWVCSSGFRVTVATHLKSHYKDDFYLFHPFDTFLVF